VPLDPHVVDLADDAMAIRTDGHEATFLSRTDG
jgi:hypothetical protein